jgi:hypothetical protein
MDDPKKEDRAPGGNAQDAKDAANIASADKQANWSHDIENREYYYDDATGYEVYDPEREEEDTESEARKDEI